jgi:arylformamidase
MGLSSADYECEYNNRARVPGHPAIIAAWKTDAEAYRRHQGAELDVRYGPSPRMAIDIFHAAGDGEKQPLVLFIHGGYWQGLDRRDFSHLAAGLNAQGISVAIPSYDLCPNVTVRQIVDQMRAAVAFLHARTGQPIVASGHSAGGHLTAALLATDWRTFDAALPRDLVPAGLAISGLFDLTPLLETSLNGALKLDKAEALALSPLFWRVPAGRHLEAWVGGDESDEFLRQSGEIARAWREMGAATAYRTVDGANHFTVVAPLVDPESAMTQALVRMVQMAG